MIHAKIISLNLFACHEKYLIVLSIFNTSYFAEIQKVEKIFILVHDITYLFWILIIRINSKDLK